MNDAPILTPGGSHLAARGRQGHRSTSDSPTRQRQTDDLLSRLTPRTAVRAFRNPSGALKRCMDESSPSEQAFAMRVAVASSNIHNWLEELSAWPWPTHDTSAGFERPPAKRRKLFSPEPPAEDDEPQGGYLGSLPATEVARYERRVNEISHDVEDLDVEEIKNHILHNHIMPLSRPGTPMSDSLRSGVAAYARMDDFTALITATIVQALPNLSKLTKLLNAWSVRLIVLRKSEGFLGALSEAEVALGAGWKVIGSPPNMNSEDAETQGVVPSKGSPLMRSDFDIMKPLLERNVAKAGQYLDYMLDTLEGREDTLPEDWIDRMDSIEQEYADWVAACERKIREAEWAKILRETRDVRVRALPDIAEESNTVQPKEEVTIVHEVDNAAASVSFEPLHESAHAANGTAKGSGTLKLHSPGLDLGTPDFEYAGTKDNSPIATTPVIKVHPAEEDVPRSQKPVQEPQHTRAAEAEVEDRSHSGEMMDDQPKTRMEQESDIAQDELARFDSVEDTAKPVNVDAARHITVDDVHQEASPDSGEPTEPDSRAAEQAHEATDMEVPDEILKPYEVFTSNDGYQYDNDLDSDLDFPLGAEALEPELPALPRERRQSEVSNTSTIIHGLPSEFTSFSSDMPSDLPSDLPEVGTPYHHRLRDIVLPSTEIDHLRSDDLSPQSPPSSPPAFRSSTRSVSVSFNDIPTVVEASREGTPEGTPPRTPLDLSLVDEEDLPQGITSRGSPSKMSVASADDQLQQQISEILENIPAKIKLTSEPSAINLNPPDFNMPTNSRAAKQKSDPFQRSYSSMSNRSSRAGTPSFTLAPAYAKNPRPRQMRGNQEIKLYHLSRSNGEPPIKLFIRCVGENGERVMVRVGGGWADLGEYLKEYASHHGRRSGGDGKVEIRDLPRISTASRAGSSPPSRPASAMDMSSPVTPLNVRKARRSVGAAGVGDEILLPMAKQPLPKTPLANAVTPAKSSDDNNKTPSSGASSRSRSSSRLSWTEEDSSLGMAGPKAKSVEMSEESKAWVESVKEKVRIASGDRSSLPSGSAASTRAKTPVLAAPPEAKGKFGELGKVGATKRLFRTGAGPGK